MMQLYLIRHGIAGERAEYATDAERPLTEAGRKKTRRVAERLLACDLRLELVLTSPLLRARQTADILQAVGLAAQVQEFAALAPGGELQTWLDWRDRHPLASVAVVGHQPDLGQWATQVGSGARDDQLVVKKAGVIGIELPPSGSPLGASELFLLTAPRWLL
ncbi:MAG: phosphohistidine phosphatase SixA [Spirulinaceae cyanobacterium RM2_2_10]|nr:phosphohistidine phosphatase SixA [Spirulinaceae cyanobacterium RM2_2_10]